MAEKDLLKTIIRSILTSTPRDTTIDQLWKEYRESEGREFPYAALGYKSFWEYLKSIPDVVKLEQMPYGSTVVRPVASDKSAHIEKLVMNQRISVPSRNSRKRSIARRRRSAIAKLPDKSYVGVKSIPSLLDTKYKPPSMSGSHSSSPPLTPDMRHSESSDSKCSMNQEAYDSCEDLEVRLDQVTYPYDDGNVDPLGRRVFLKNGVETTVDELSEGIRFSKGKSPINEAASNSNIHGLNVFLSDWSKLEPRGITSPAKPEFIHNRVQLIPRYIEFGAPEVHAAGPQHKRIVNEIRHRNYEALVMTIKMSSRLYLGSESCNKIIIPNEVVDKLLNLLEKNSEGMRVCDIGRRLVVSQKTIDRLSDLNINSVDDILRNLDEYVTVSGDKVFPKIIISSKPNGLNCVPYGSDYECSGSALNGRNSVCSGSSNECTINGTLVTNLKVILQENPRGVLCDNLPQIYYDKYRSPLDPTDFGFNNVLEMFSYLQHQTNEFYLIRDINRNGWAVTLLTHVDSTVSQNTDADSQSCTLQAGFMINNFKKILMNYQPITSNDLLIKYNMFYGRENGIQSLGFKSIEEFINSKLKSIIDVSKSKSTQFICLKSDFLHPTALPEAQEINDIMYSEDVCLIDDKLPPFVITFSHNLPTKVEFIVSDATNPECFSMQLVSSYKVLDKLMTDLYYFYEENEADYLMCEEAITIDALCASTFAADDDWHRARIMAVYSETVLLDYVDYGSTFNQSKSKLRLLHKKFSKLPVQSIGAKQRGIKPPGNSFQWPSEVRYKLLQVFENSIVVAEVFSIDSKRSFLEVNLIHVGPENEETLFTNILVTRGLAEYSDLPDGNGEELDNIKRTVPTKRDLRSSNSTQRNTSYSESSNKSSIEDEKIPGTSYEYYTQERKESEYNSLSRSMTNSVEDILSRTMEQLEVSSQNEEPPLKTNCSRPPPGFADTNRTQNLFTTGYLIGLTQLQQAGSMVFNLDGVFNDSTPIIPNESILLIQPLSQCPVCRLVYMDTTVSLELLTPLVQHNLRHVQVFYNTLRQNMFLKLNPAAADMLNIFNNAASITSLLSSTPGAQNLSVSPNVLPKFPVPQTVNTIHFDNSLPGTSSVVPNNVLQSLNHVTSDPTLPTLNSVHISNSFNTSRSDKCNVLEISSDTVLPTTYSHPSNMRLELTDVIGSQLDDTVTEQRYDAVVTSRTMTDLTPQLINPSRTENLERNHENILEVSESGTVIESKSLLSNDYTKPVTEMATQPVKLNLASVNKQCVLEPVNVGTMTSVYNMHNLQSQDIDTTYHKFISTGVNTLPNNKSGASAGEPQESHVDNTVISRFIEPEIYDMLESDFDIFMSSQQMNTESIPPANPHISGRLMETVQTCICKKCGRTNNKCDHSTVVCQQEVSTSTILPFNKEQCNYSDYKVHNTFRSSLDTFSEPRSTESLSPGSLHISDRLTETVRTGICKKCGVPSTDCYNTESHQEEISAAPSLQSVLSRKNSCGSEISHSSDTCVESLSELEIIPESCANNLKTKTTKPKGIPGRSFSKRIY